MNFQKLNIMSMSDQELNQAMDDYERLAQPSNHHETPSKTRRRGHKLKPWSEDIETILAKKRSIVKTKHLDQLCCARAIITMKARTDQHDKYDQIRHGRPIQTVLAQQLHAEAGVPEGPCGIPELQKFQDHLSNYQLKVLAVDKPYRVIFQGPSSDKKILLVKVNDHYHGCSSYGGFLSKSYFCHQCNKAYDHAARHPCHVNKNILIEENRSKSSTLEETDDEETDASDILGDLTM